MIKFDGVLYDSVFYVSDPTLIMQIIQQPSAYGCDEWVCFIVYFKNGKHVEWHVDKENADKILEWWKLGNKAVVM